MTTSYEVKRYSDADLFYDHVEPFLLRNEAANNLTLGIIGGVQRGSYSDVMVYMGCVERDGAVVLVAVRTPPFNMVLSWTDDLGAIPPLAADVHDFYAQEQVAGVQATKTVAAAFANAWSEQTGATLTPKMAMRIFQLERVNPVADVEGELRRLGADDERLANQWYNAFQEEALGEVTTERNQKVVQRRVQAAPEDSGLHVWEVGGVPVSLAGYSGATPNGLRIGPVYTPPEYRRRGYGSAVTAALSQAILDMGKRYCFLFTDLANPTSNHIYKEVGYEPVCDVDTITFNTSTDDIT